jgi:phage shock protein PspC (stress-responsive transcriptional regulator)
MSIKIKKRLYKSINYRFLTGVAAGLADYLEAPRTSIRILFILLALASGIGLVFYLALSVLLPTEQEIVEQEDLEFYQTAVRGLQSKDDNTTVKTSTFLDELITAQNIVAIIILFFGIFILQFNIVPWALIPDSWRYPALFITIGIAFILKSLTNTKSNIL